MTPMCQSAIFTLHILTGVIFFVIFAAHAPEKLSENCQKTTSGIKMD